MEELTPGIVDKIRTVKGVTSGKVSERKTGQRNCDRNAYKGKNEAPRGA